MAHRGDGEEGDGEEGDGEGVGEDGDDQEGGKGDAAEGGFEGDEWEEGEVERGMLHAFVELGHLEMLLHQVRGLGALQGGGYSIRWDGISGARLLYIEKCELISSLCSKRKQAVAVTFPSLKLRASGKTSGSVGMVARPSAR